jgi:thiol:disulfide interchange protein DsbD
MNGVETDLGLELSKLLQGTGGHLGAQLLWAYAVAFLAGVLTSLTPCVYPLIPITVSLFGARGEKISRATAMGLAACYVGGIALMYSSLGVIVGLGGGRFGTFLASRVVMIPIALFFLAMAASMFGAFELALPSSLQGRLSQVGGKGAVGAFLMGLVAGLIAAPCTGPPLAALLVFVGTQKSVLLGGSLLFVYALGIGVLFFAIAGFALNLPKSGPWMDAVKSAFGVVMIVAAMYFLRSVVAPLRDYGRPQLSFLVLHAAALVSGAIVGGLHLSFGEGSGAALRKGLGVLLITIGLYGSVAWVLTPKNQAVWQKDEAQAVAQARREGRPLLIDFRAEWCLPCKKLEIETFSDKKVLEEMSRFVLLKIDCTNPDEASEKLQTKYDSQILPSVLIYDGRGQQVKKLGEWIPPDKLLPILQQTR